MPNTSYKECFIKSIEESLVDKLDCDQIEIVINEVIKVMYDYEITKLETALVTYKNINESIMKRFCASLYIEGKSEKTIYQYQRTAWKLYDVVKKHFTEIGVYDIRLFLALEKQRGLSNVSLENSRANLSAFFQWMVNEDIINKNPCTNVAKIKCNDKVRTPFSSVEIDSMRHACENKKERALLEMLLSTGVRVSELSNMKLCDINFDNLSVHVVHGKGDKERTTYMTDVAKIHLLNYLEQRGDLGEYVFYNIKKGRLTSSGVRYVLNKIGKKSSVENVHPHRFRRTFASGLASRGMDVQEIKKLLGHSDINTTMKYVYTDDQEIKNSYMKFIA